MPAELADTDPDWSGVRFLRGKDDYNPAWDALGFEHEFASDSDHHGDNWGRHLWVYAEESGNPDNVAHLVQKFLKACRPEQCWSLTYAATCSKPRVGEFEGGAVFVTADGFQHQNAYAFIEEQRATFALKEKNERNSRSQSAGDASGR